MTICGKQVKKLAYYYFKNLFLYRKYDFFIAIDEVLYRKF